MTHDWEQCNHLAAALVCAALDDDHPREKPPAEFEMRDALAPLMQRYYDLGVPPDRISRTLRRMADLVDHTFREDSEFDGLCYTEAVAQRARRRRARSGEVRLRLVVDNTENEAPA